MFIVIKTRPRTSVSSQQITEQIIQKLPVSRSTSVTYDKIGKYIKNNLRLKKNTNVIDLNGVFNAYNSARENIRANVFENFIRQADEQIKKRIGEFGEMNKGGQLKLREDKDRYFDSVAELVTLQRHIDHRVYVDSNSFNDKSKLFLADLQTHKSVIIPEEQEDDRDKQVISQTQKDVSLLLNIEADKSLLFEEDDVENEFEFTQVQVQNKKIKSKVIRG